MGYQKFYVGKHILIFGGSEGIGQSIALKLAACGAQVTIASRSEKKRAETLALSKKANPKHAMKDFEVDVAHWEKTKAAVDVYVEKYGTPDILINCAGLARPGYINELSINDFKTMMDVNYFGTLHTVKALAPYFIARGSGQIVNTSSIAGFVGLFGYTGYCASKYAVIGFSKALRSELKPQGIKVSVLCPPNTKTPGLVEENKTKPKEVLKTEEKATVVEPDYVAEYLLKTLPSGKFMLIPTMDGNLAYHISRYSPWLIDQIVKRPHQ